MASALFARAIPPHESHVRSQQSGAQQQAPPQPSADAPVQQASPSQPPLPVPVHLGPIVVLDPGHGGTDPGAHGENGIVEKDVVLQFARALRAELERLGYHVVMTRNDDSDPSYDDRAALANAYRDPVFVSLHISSTGTAGTARAYFYQFSSPLASAVPASAATPWEEAQRPYGDASRRLANLVQIELTHRFSGSPNAPAPVAVRSLRSVAAPAVAVEISSVAVSDPAALTSLAGPIAISVARGITAFHPILGTAAGQP
ncbi:MAG: N-acetylmuramoyl-L-alanine amidase [Candidatus Acidiferrales bacterium]